MNDFVIALVVNAAWQTTLIAVIAIALARFMSANARFIALSLALLAAVATPLVALLPRKTLTPAPFGFPPMQPSGGSLLAIVYGTGLAIAILRFAARLVRARRLLATCTSAGKGIRVSDTVAAPLTIGRSIILPRVLLEANDDTLIAAAIAHESAHIARRDYAAHLLLEVAALPLFFHPAIALLRRRLADAREIACDERAAAECGARAYAGALVRIASVAVRQPTFAMSMASTAIERRVALLLKPRRRWTLPLLAASVPILLVTAACNRWSVTPAVAGATLCGRWSLVRAASDFHHMVPPAYDEFTQLIAQGPHSIAVHQHRVAGGRAQNVAWSVITDGVPRELAGIANARGTARRTRRGIAGDRRRSRPLRPTCPPRRHLND